MNEDSNMIKEEVQQVPQQPRNIIVKDLIESHMKTEQDILVVIFNMLGRIEKLESK